MGMTLNLIPVSPFPCPKSKNSLFNRHHAHRRAANIDPLPCPKRQAVQQGSQMSLMKPSIVQRGYDKSNLLPVKRYAVMAE